MSWLGIQELRKATGVTAKDLAEKIDKDASYVSKIEKGYIINTSYDTVMSMAKVVADTEAIKSGKVDLNDYDSEFAKLVLSCRIDDMKEMYQFSKNNQEFEDYAFLIKYLKKEDMKTFMTLAKYRKSEVLFNTHKESFIQSVLQESGAKSINEFLKILNRKKQFITFNINIDFEEIVKGEFEVIIDSISEELNNKYGLMKQVGLEEIIQHDYESTHEDEPEGEVEIILPEPQ